MHARSGPAWDTPALSYGNARVDRCIAALLVTFAACSAAFVAHVTIDALGDILIAHDSYDHIAHSSRAVALGAALLLGAGISWHVVRRAFEEARGGKRSLRAALQRICRGSQPLFVARVVPLTIVALVAMGVLDASLDGCPIDDLSQLFGGSIALGLGVAIPIALAAGIAGWALLRFIAASHRMIVGAIATLIALLIRAREVTPFALFDGGCFPHCHFDALRAKRLGLRGPPPLRA
jgi:hypothetical protein